MDPITTTSKFFIFVISSTLWSFSYSLLTSDWPRKFISLFCIICRVMRDKIVRLSVTFKINQTASKNLQNFIQFWSTKFWKQTAKRCLILWKTSEQQTEFRHGKFNMNHPKLFRKCSVTYKISQISPVFQLGNFLISYYGPEISH